MANNHVRNFNTILLILFLMSVSLASFGGELTIGDTLRLGDNLQVTKSKLGNSCQKLETLEIASPRYPLAAEQEMHLICEQYRNSDITFGKAILVFADDQLVQMEAIDVSVAELKKALGEPQTNYLEMAVYQKGAYWLDETQARLIWLNNDAMHPNLFSWHNPYLDKINIAQAAASIEIPDLLDFNSDLDNLKPLFKQQCGQMQQENHQEIWLLNQPEVQVQINCFGFLFGGFERKFEAVFGDGKLQVVWILTGKAEELRLRKLLVTRWGEPEINNDQWEVYAKGRISLRKDKPELLVLSDQMIPLYRNQLESPEAE